eukprot:jgi/Mesvir1/1220/Mv17706-RA.1
MKKPTRVGLGATRGAGGRRGAAMLYQASLMVMGRALPQERTGRGVGARVGTVLGRRRTGLAGPRVLRVVAQAMGRCFRGTKRSLGDKRDDDDDDVSDDSDEDSEMFPSMEFHLKPQVVCPDGKRCHISFDPADVQHLQAARELPAALVRQLIRGDVALRVGVPHTHVSSLPTRASSFRELPWEEEEREEEKGEGSEEGAWMAGHEGHEVIDESMNAGVGDALARERRGKAKQGAGSKGQKRGVSSKLAPGGVGQGGTPSGSALESESDGTMAEQVTADGLEQTDAWAGGDGAVGATAHGHGENGKRGVDGDVRDDFGEVEQAEDEEEAYFGVGRASSQHTGERGVPTIAPLPRTRAPPREGGGGQGTGRPSRLASGTVTRSSSSSSSRPGTLARPGARSGGAGSVSAASASRANSQQRGRRAGTPSANQRRPGGMPAGGMRRRTAAQMSRRPGGRTGAGGRGASVRTTSSSRARVGGGSSTGGGALRVPRAGMPRRPTGGAAGMASGSASAGASSRRAAGATRGAVGAGGSDTGSTQESRARPRSSTQALPT